MAEELTVKEAAARHGITASWLIRNLDKIQHRQIGPVYLVDAESVAAWAEHRPRRGGSQKGVPWSKKKATEAEQRSPTLQETSMDAPDNTHED